MKKRVLEKLSISVIFLSMIFLTCFAGGAFATVRNGFSQAMKYDFEIKKIATDLGINIDDGNLPSQSVDGDGTVEFYCKPVSGEVVSKFSQNMQGNEYECRLILTVKAASNGEIADIIQNGASYEVTVKNKQGYNITVTNLKNVYVSYGQQVSAGQIIGALNNDGKAFVRVVKDGVACDPEEVF